MMTGTFSIAALDRETGEIGVGVASRALAVGALVPVIAAVAIVIVVLLSQIPAILYVNRLDLARATKEKAT